MKSEKLYRLACASFIRECGDLFLTMISQRDVRTFRRGLEKRRLSPTTVRIYMTLVKVVLHFAEKRKMCRFEDDPFEDVPTPSANVRELDLTTEELKAIRDLEPTHYNIGVARDIFMLSYYLGGMNLVNMLEVDFRKSYIEYYRQKTKNKKKGESKTAFTVQPEAREIIRRYMKKNGKLCFGKYDTLARHIRLSLARLKPLRNVQEYRKGWSFTQPVNHLSSTDSTSESLSKRWSIASGNQ